MKASHLSGVCLFAILAFSTASVKADGNYSATESWSVTLTLGTGSGTSTKTFTGKETGTLTVTNNEYVLINHTGAPLSLLSGSLSRRIIYDQLFGQYEIAGSLPGIGGINGQELVIVPLNLFVIAIPIGGSQSGFGGGWASRTHSFSATGTSLSSFVGSGVYVDINYPDSDPGYLNEADESSTSSLAFLSPLPSGSLQVQINPLGAVTAGAMWQVDGGPFQNSGDTVSNLWVGNHTVAFAPVAGWTTPTNQTVAIVSQKTTLTIGTYVLVPVGSLQVTLGPAGAVSAGGKWQVDGGAFQGSGAVVTNLAVGTHTVSFSALSGWTTPPNQTVSVNPNSTTMATGTYLEALPPQITSASLPNGGDGVAYSQQLAAISGQRPYTWSILSGALPAGLTLATNGIISGTPTNDGMFSFTVKVTDAVFATVTKPLTLTVGIPPTVTFQGTTDSIKAAMGNDVKLAMSVAGTGPFRYQWRLNGTNLPNGVITTVAGNGTKGYSEDGNLATNAELSGASGVAVDAAGNLYIADGGNSRVRKVGTDGMIVTVAGNGTNSYSGDGGPATSAELWQPYAVAVDATGNRFIADLLNHDVRKVGTNGVITTVAGTGSGGYSGDAGPAINAQLHWPNGVAVDAVGNLFISDEGNQRIRMVAPNGVITTIAGNGSNGYSGDGGPATSAQLSDPEGVAVDATGNLLIVDFGNQRIRKVGTDGIITTIAGTGSAGYFGDGWLATFADLSDPEGVATDFLGNLFIADTYNNRIRMIGSDGIISTLAGNGTSAYGGDGNAAIDALLHYPIGITADSIGNLFFSDYYNYRIRKITFQGPTLEITNLNAGNTGAYDVVASGPFGSATSSLVNVSVIGSVTDTPPDCFTLTTNKGGIIITGYRCPERTVSIPSVINGLPVTGIGDGAFANSAVANVTVPGTVTNIGVIAFYQAWNLSTITVTADNPFYSSSDGVLFDKSQTTLLAYPAGRSGTYAVPSGVAAIGRNAFYECYGLTGIFLGTNVVEIGDYAFADARGLGAITLPSTITKIGVSPFGGCSSLAEVTVDNNNPAYRGDSGVLFSKDETVLIQYPAGNPRASYFVPGSVVQIGQGAFSECQNMANVTIADSVTEIGSGAFSFSSGLTTVTIGNGVTTIGSEAFWVCTNLAKVAFGSSVTTIGPQSFAGTRLNTLTIPPSVRSLGAVAFSDCPSLSAVYFQGNAPSADCTVFERDANLLTVDYLPGTTGWGQTFACVPTAVTPGVYDTISVSASPSAGGTVSGGGTFADGSSETVTASANTGYTFANWTESGNSVSSAATYTLKITSNLNLVANFEAITGSAPMVTLQPTNSPVLVQVGGQVSLSATVTGAGPFNYQWRLNGTNLPNGIITTVAGIGPDFPARGSYSGDGGPATNAVLNGPQGVAVDASGSLFIADTANQRIRKVTEGIIDTVAGNGTGYYSGDGGPASNAGFLPWGVGLDKAGNLFIADGFNNRIRKASTNGIITTVAGIGPSGGTGSYSGNGGAATDASLNEPQSVAVDAAGNLFVADTYNNRVRKVSTNGIITTVAGIGPSSGAGSYSGDGGTATNASLDHPSGVALDASGNLFIADTYNNRIRMVDTNGVITTLAGSGPVGSLTGHFSGDGGPATNATLNEPISVSVDTSGNLFIADLTNERIRKVDTDGIITTVAGNGTNGSTGDGGAATNASFVPWAVALDNAGNVFIADPYNNRIRRVSFHGPILVLNDVGSGNAGAYDVVVTSPYGSVTSTIVNVAITTTPSVNFTYTTNNGAISITGYTGPAGAVTIPSRINGLAVAVIGNGQTSVFPADNVNSVTIPDSVTSIGSFAFGGCSSLTNVYFQGNAPGSGTDLTVFSNDNQAIVYYLAGTTGWGMTFDGRPTALRLLPNPLILNNGLSFGVQPNGFGFIISWATNNSVVVEASASLVNPVWAPVATNTLIGGSSYFSDPQWMDYPARFYRLHQVPLGH